MDKTNKKEMEMDMEHHGILIPKHNGGSFPVGPEHGGYAAIIKNKAVGRYAYYEVALRRSTKVVRWVDLERFGYEAV